MRNSPHWADSRYRTVHVAPISAAPKSELGRYATQEASRDRTLFAPVGRLKVLHCTVKVRRLLLGRPYPTASFVAGAVSPVGPLSPGPGGVEKAGGLAIGFAGASTGGAGSCGRLPGRPGFLAPCGGFSPLD